MAKKDTSPPHYPVARLGSVVVFPPSASRPRDGDIPFISMSRLPSSGLYATDFELIPASIVRSGLAIADGDLLLAKITPCFENGKQGIVRGLPGGVGMATTEVIRMRGSEEVDIEYLAYILQEPHRRRTLAALMEGTTGRQRLPRAALEDVGIPLPTLATQRAISNMLSTIQRAREAARRELRASETLVYSLLDRCLDETLTQDQPKLVPLTDLIERDRPICYGILKPGPDIESGIPYVRVVDYPSGQVIVGGLRRVSPEIAYQYRRASLRAGDILVSIRGTYGKVARVPDELDGANITQDTARVSPSAAVNDGFLLWYLRSRRAQQYMKESATGVAVRGVNIGALRQLPVPVPRRDRQQAIAFAVQTADGRRRAVERHLQAIGRLFDSLLGELVSGKQVLTQ
jgi:type I restriction enzyme S subunit